MKNIYKLSTALFMALAVFAMIFTGCKKSDSSNNGGGVIPTPTPPIGDYGTITVAGQEYNIVIASYKAYYDEELQKNVVAIGLADGITEDANIFALSLIGVQNLPSNGTYEYTVQDPMPDGSCSGMLKSQQGVLLCIDGTATLSGTADNYSIQSSGSATPLGGNGQEMSFNVNFNGPMIEAQE